ncbi:MAG: 50S ribosome-binding GTPase [Bacteroidetes bacterium]|nr:50S ribosome-binding GTPase [Bacteroidota bacterium]
MPTNLPPEYYEAEKKFKDAFSPAEKAEAIEEMLSTIPKHKGTDKLRADYRRKLSKLKSEAKSQKKTTRHDSYFHIEKEGDARIAIVGDANTGKSSLVAALTHAHPEVSDSPFSTWIPTPGLLEVDNIRFQLIDTPPITRDYIEPECYDLLRTSDMILIMLDIQDYPIKQIEETLDKLEAGKIAPFSKKHRYDGKSMKFIPMIIAVNKLDDAVFREEYDVLEDLLSEEWNLIPISVKHKFNLENLFHEMVERMHLIRIFSKPPHRPADLTRPFVLKENSTIDDFANRVHHDFSEKLKSARVWGTGVRDGQQVGREHVLSDKDIVELHM